MTRKHVQKVTIQMKATHKVILTFDSVVEILKCDHSNESYWAVLSCCTVYYAVQGCSTFESVVEILKCDHSNRKATEQFFPVVNYAVQRASNFWVRGWNPEVWPFKSISYWYKTHIIWRTFYNLERPLHLHRWKPLTLSRRQVFISSVGGLPRSLTKSGFTVQVACRKTINPPHLELFELT